ncbi:MAG TPA: diaminopimelate epimerase [Thermoanaerobaculia bacterium]
MTAFFKVSGSGNDFLALAEPAEVPPPERIRAWCRRGVSLGADGLFILRRAGGGTAMDYFNSDGHPADLCLNGTRCAAQLAFHLGWAGEAVEVLTGAGSVAARRLDPGRVAVEMPVPEAPEELALEAGGIRHAGYRLRVGVPHFVLVWPEELSDAPVRELGAKIRGHAAFGSEGTNVSFVRFPGRRRMEIRTFERGVEDETLSCGTGVLAGAAAGIASGQAGLPLEVMTQGGFELEVDADPRTGRWLLSGDARVIARGELLPGADRETAPPPWT